MIEVGDYGAGAVDQLRIAQKCDQRAGVGAAGSRDDHRAVTQVRKLCRGRFPQPSLEI
jgi:hypothetical protein